MSRSPVGGSPLTRSPRSNSPVNRSSPLSRSRSPSPLTEAKTADLNQPPKPREWEAGLDEVDHGEEESGKGKKTDLSELDKLTRNYTKLYPSCVDGSAASDPSTGEEAVDGRMEGWGRRESWRDGG